MRAQLVSGVWRVLRWLEPETAWLRVPNDALLARARTLTAWADADGGNGESKRHQVYARLIKEFPARPRKAIARAIEAAVA